MLIVIEEANKQPEVWVTETATKRKKSAQYKLKMHQVKKIHIDSAKIPSL